MAGENDMRADLMGLETLEKAVADCFERLSARAGGNSEAFEEYFSALVRKELSEQLDRLRNEAVGEAVKAGAGSAATAVLRRMYRDALAGNINIGGNRKAAASMKREQEDPTGGRSGIHRDRTVKARTKRIREYYGPDRGFILRILESGRDEYMATSDGPTGRGSMATYGRRGSIGARNWFFHSMSSDMELAAKELGETLVGHVEKWVERKMKSEG
jgi:hypothetical protein